MNYLIWFCECRCVFYYNSLKVKFTIYTKNSSNCRYFKGYTSKIRNTSARR